jgi:hypothetical protein
MKESTNIRLIEENDKPHSPPADHRIFLALRADSLDIARSKLRAFRRMHDPNDASAENTLEALAFWVEGLQQPMPPVPVRPSRPAFPLTDLSPAGVSR